LKSVLFYENKLNRFAEIGHCTMTLFLLQNCIQHLSKNTWIQLSLW